MDFKNSDIHSAPVITDLNGTEAAAALDAAATVAVAMQAGNILPLTADGQLVLPAGVGLDDIKVVGRDLVIQMPDGTQMIVPDGAVFVPEIVVEGVAVPPLNIAALLIGQEPQPAAGRPQSSGGNFADAVGDIGDPFGLGDLLPPTQLAFPGPEEPEIIPYLVDRDPDVVIQDGGPISRDVVDNVSEVGLPGTRSNGNVESPGSSTGNGADSTTGTIFVTSPDGIASITINGVIVTGTAGQQIVTARGVLTLGALSDGQIGYTYRLTDNTSGDATSDPFTVVVTDLDGDVASARLTINIADDSPTARNDTDSVPAASYIGQTGNVITGVGTTSGNAGADTQGADGAVLSGIRAGDSAGSFAAAGTTINGQYGTLTIAANGSYTYTRNAGTPGGVNDVFTYQLTDGDGDTSTATLTISIADSPVTITSVPTTGAGTVVDEAGLPARGTEPPGSNAAAPSESTSGTITFTAPDGVASVAINGIAITGAGQVITVSTGTLLITGYNPATGTLAYTFTLTDNTSGDATSQIFTITVTDTDGDTASSPFTVRIIDDVPTARNDSGTQAAENIPVTVNIIANDTQGADGVNLSTGVALVAGSLTGTGTLVYNNNGTFTYTPAPGEQGVVTFNYTITDSDGDVSTATVTINLLEDSTPSLRVAGDNDVNESGLPARAGEPEGSDSAAPSETAVGTITVATGGDSIASLVINGVNVTAGGTVNTAFGTLVVTLSGGVYSYSYTLADNTIAATSSDTFTIVLTDSDGDTASSNLVIAIIDDAPTAVADTDSIAAGNYGPATGNVISDGEGDGGKDVQGADGVTVTNVTGAGGSGAAGAAVSGLYGILTINADGSYSYVRNAGSPGGVSDVFTYTITDGDGDTSSTTLTIAIADSPTSLTLPVKGEAGTSVDEAGLPAGSNAAADSEKTAGTITYSAPDGPASVTIDGVTVTSVGQIFNGSFGTLKITSIANGVIGYEYLLTTNTSGDATFDDFAVVITDQDGDSSNGTLVVDIVDDVPTARADLDSVTEDDFSGATVSADGNVLTGAGGSDANGTDGVSDTKGADGASVTAVAFGAIAGTVGGSTAGEYGTLTLNADGSYSYVLNNSDLRIQGLDSGESFTEVFTYTLTDGDGDTRTTTLTITINGADDGITITGLNIDSPDLILDDDDLPDGSDPVKEPLTQTGSFTVEGVDGISSIKIQGQEAVVGLEFTNAYGTFKIISIVTNLTAGGDPASVTVNYSYTLNDNVTHPSGAGQNSIIETFGVEVTDTDGSTETATIKVEIVDDVPTAVNDTDSIAAGAFGPATGNVITDAEGDGGADTRGADGANVTAITGAAAGTVGGTTAGLYGVLTLNADGSYSYVRNAGTPGGVSDVFTYTITDGDGDTSTATLTIAIADAQPLTGPNATVLLDDDALAGGNPGGTGDDVDSANVTGTLAGSGGDGALTWTAVSFTSPAGFSATLVNPGLVEVRQGATLVMTIAINNATGDYTVTQVAPIDHSALLDENNSGFSFGYRVTDADGDQAFGSLSINIDDDTPVVSNDTDSLLAGATGPATGNVLTDADPGDAGDSDTGADSLGADGGSVTGITGFGGAGTIGGTTTGQYGTLTLNADGSYSYVRNGTGPLNATDTFTYTVTDGDGDTATATLMINIADAAPVTGANLTVLLDDDALAGGNPGGTGDDVDSANVTGTLAGSGGDGALTWTAVSFTSPAGFSATLVNPGLVEVRQGATLVMTIAINNATGDYTVTQVAPIDHSALLDENNSGFSFGYRVTDADGDEAFGSLSINIDDDTPTASNDVDEILSGSAAPATGNVITDAEGDGGADSVGADGGAAIVAITGFGGAGAVGGTTNGQYGVLTINSDGSYSYVRNSGTPGNVEDVFTYTLTDADGDTVTATLTISIEDARPITGPNLTVLLDDDALAGGNAGGTGDDADSANLTGILAGSGGDGSLTWAYQTSGNPAGFTYVANGTGLDVFQGATKVLVVTLNTATGGYSVAQVAPIIHANGGDENNQNFTINYTVTDADGDTAPGTLTINVDDDSPTIVGSATQPVLAVDETALGTNATASFAGVFTTAFGADGPAAVNAVTYTLSVVSGPSGLVDTATGEAVNLVMNGAIVEGRSAVTNQLVFTVSVAANGDVTLDQIRAVVHNDPADPDEPGASAATITDNLVKLTATATDKDSDAASATVNIGQNLQFEDDGPSVTASTTQPTLVVDDTTLGTNASADFSAVFAPLFGADGAATVNSVTYALAITAGASGLVDVATGEAVNLVLNGSVVEGRSATTNQLVFTLSVDAGGNVTLDQIRAVQHNDPLDADEAGASAATLTADNLVRLVATVTDKDGDTASATANIGQNLQFKDDGPSVTASTTQPVLAVDETTFATNAVANFANVFTPLFGTDGAAAANSVTYALGFNAGATGLVDTATGLAVVLTLEAGQVVGRAGAGGAIVFTVTVAANGDVTLDQQRAVVHNDPADPDEPGASAATLSADNLVTLTATVTDRDGDTATATATANIGQNFQFEDDGPSVTASPTEPDLAVDETVLATNAIANFASVFVPLFGADGAAVANSVTYALGFNAGATGLVDTATGLAVVLTLETGQVVGRAGAGGAIVFTVSVAANGDVTLDQQRAVVHNDPADPDEPGASAATLSADNLITLTATATDKDGDTATATVNLGQNLQFEDDGPSVTASTTEPVLIVDDTTLGTDSSANFAGVFTPVFGADGAATANSITYALAITAGASGLVDVATGEVVNLVLNGTVVEGRSATTNALVFTLTVDASGSVTLDQIRAVQHNDPADADEPGASAATLSADNLIRLIATVTDKDGDTQSATANIGQNLLFKDDGPGAVNDIVGQVTENVAFSFNVFGNDSFGADGVDTTDVTPPAGVTFTQPPVGQGTVTYNPGTGLFTFTPAAGQQGSTSFTYTIIDRDGDPSTATVTVNLQPDSAPVTVNVVAAVDDDGLGGNNPASTTGDIDANAGEVGAGVGNEAVYTGQITVNFGNDTGTVSFANLHNTFGSVGTETVKYTWSGTTLTATVDAGARTGTVLYTVNLTPSGAYTVTLLDNVLHASGGDETSAPVVDLNYLASDSDGDSSTTGKLSITFNDDAPTATAPKATVMINTNGSIGGNFLDADNDVDNNYGADGGKVIFTAATITSLQSQNLTSGFSTLNYVISSDGTVLTATKSGDNSTVFTIALQPNLSPDQYVVTMSQPLDSAQTVDFNAGGYNFVGGNGSWAGFTQPAVANSDDVLLTPIGGGTVNTNANEGGVAGGNSVGSGESMRVDFVKDLVGSPVSGGDFYGGDDTQSFTGHYTVNGAGALFTSITSSTTISLKAFDDADTGTLKNVGDGVADAINKISITHGAVTQLITTSGTYVIDGISYTVTFSGGIVTVGGVADNTRIAGFTATGFNSIEFGYVSGNTFKIGDFGASVIKNQPVNFTVPVTITDNDGDSLNSGSLAITLNPPVAPLAPLGDAETAMPAETMLLATEQQMDNSGSTVAATGETQSATNDAGRMTSVETASPSIISLAANDRSSEQLRTSSNVTATVIAASLVGLAITPDAAAAATPDNARLDMMTNVETATPGQVVLATETAAPDAATQLDPAADPEPARSTGDAASNLQAVDDGDLPSGLNSGLNSEPASQPSDLLAGGADVVTMADLISGAAPLGGDVVMHNILDIAAANLTAASNDNPAAPALENVVDEALPDSMVDNLIDAFAGDSNAPIMNANASDSSGYLVELINQTVSSSPDFATLHVDPFGSQIQDMATTHNG